MSTRAIATLDAHGEEYWTGVLALLLHLEVSAGGTELGQCPVLIGDENRPLRQLLPLHGPKFAVERDLSKVFQADLRERPDLWIKPDIVCWSREAAAPHLVIIENKVRRHRAFTQRGGAPGLMIELMRHLGASPGFLIVAAPTDWLNGPVGRWYRRFMKQHPGSVGFLSWESILVAIPKLPPLPTHSLLLP